ncbi:Protein POLYCHOME [Striga hermonthica]|uniref:Protein POLYCHOME n=1 Tax=Striga hermonthica TaxID=68872 RepID=A0A9N7R144_STRHE|nr:Protein POLYCHOME [Striga hermonthica]
MGPAEKKAISICQALRAPPLLQLNSTTEVPSHHPREKNYPKVCNRMPEARDRLSRRYLSRGNVVRVNSIAFVLEDEGDERHAAGTPFRWRGTAMVGIPGAGVAFGRGSVGNSRGGRVWYLGRSSARKTGLKNLSLSVGRGRGRALGSTVLPHCIHISFRVGEVPKMLLDIATNQKDGDSCKTPQKKLLENIDTVEKVVMEELRKLKRTPSAKKAEKEKRVRTLMSMR